jgi:hypothetical protein
MKIINDEHFELVEDILGFINTPGQLYRRIWRVKDDPDHRLVIECPLTVAIAPCAIKVTGRVARADYSGVVPVWRYSARVKFEGEDWTPIELVSSKRFEVDEIKSLFETLQIVKLLGLSKS